MTKLCVFFQTGKEYGYGHKYRCLELIRVAQERGIEVEGFSNDESTRLHFFINSKAPGFDKGRWKMWMNKINADWIIFDLPHGPEQYQINYCKEKGMKIANLNGSSFTPNNDKDWCDLSWVQNEPDKVILRKELLNIKYTPVPNQWLVFGGAADPLEILENFELAIQRDPAIMISTELREPFISKYPNHHKSVECNGDVIWQHMAYADKACVHAGQVMWELAHLGVKQYIFSVDEDHLQAAKNIENLRLGLAYPEIGVPPADKMRKFFMQNQTLNPDNRPDCMGADRFLDELLRLDNELE